MRRHMEYQDKVCSPNCTLVAKNYVMQSVFKNYLFFLISHWSCSVGCSGRYFLEMNFLYVLLSHLWNFCDKWIRLLICRNLEMVCKWIAWRHWYQIATEFDYRLFCDHSYLADASHINQLLCQSSSINFSFYTLVSMVMRSKYKNIVYEMPDVPILIYNLNSWLGS